APRPPPRRPARPADHLELRDALAQAVELAVDHLVGDLDRRALHRDAPVAGQVELGLDLDRGRELERGALLPARRVHLAAGPRADAVLLDRAGVELGHRLVLDRLGDQRVAADAGLDHAAGHLALA